MIVQCCHSDKRIAILISHIKIMFGVLLSEHTNWSVEDKPSAGPDVFRYFLHTKLGSNRVCCDFFYWIFKTEYRCIWAGRYFVFIHFLTYVGLIVRPTFSKRILLSLPKVALFKNKGIFSPHGWPLKWTLSLFVELMVSLSFSRHVQIYAH